MESMMRNGAYNLLLAALLLSGTGCQNGRFWPPWPKRQPEPPPCTFNAAATKQEIVAHVNRFIAPENDTLPLTSWRSTQMRVTMSGAPPLGGSIDVQAPSRLRIRAEVPLTSLEMADFGSNDEAVWFWGKGAPSMMTVSHEDLPAALQQMQIPFEPEWLMEVLGVVPLNVDDYELQRPTSDCGWVDLVAHRDSPTGERILRVVRVDTCHGHIVQHLVKRLDGELIASATLSNYGPDASGRYELPHVVELEWPVAEARLKLELGAIHANPAPLAETAWAVPHKAGVPIQRLQPPRAVGQSPGQAMRQQLYQPVLQQKLVSPQDVFSEDFNAAEPSADGPPPEYSSEAWRSSSDPLPLEQASGPRPFPGGQ
jgi:hypothetical protein